MDKITIGINQRIPIHILELALCAALQDDASPEYFSELAATEYNGENRIKKTVSVINKLTIRNPLFGYLNEHADAVLAAMKNKLDRPLLFGAVICAAYPFGFDTLSIMGKYFHVGLFCKFTIDCSTKIYAIPSKLKGTKKYIRAKWQI